MFKLQININKTMEIEQSFLTKKRVGRRQYLVTYSQADLNKFPSRESFGNMLCTEFNSGGGAVKVAHWAGCRENHADGGVHYHCSLKLTGVKKWLLLKRTIEQKHKVVLNFSDSHDHYISAYRYVCKEDQHVAHSPGHPDLSEVGSPRTKTSIAAFRRKRREPTPASATTEASSSSTNAPAEVQSSGSSNTK